MDICNYVSLVGLSHIDSLLGEKSMAAGILLTVTETSHTQADELRECGIRAVLENAANEETMNLTYLDYTRRLLLTVLNDYEAGEIVVSAREKCPPTEIIARAHYDGEVEYITEHGANQVVMGEREITRTMLELIEASPAGKVAAAS